MRTEIMSVHCYFFDGKELAWSLTNFGYDRKFYWIRTVAENRDNQFCFSKNSVCIFGKKLRLKPNISLNPVLNSRCALITMFFICNKNKKKTIHKTLHFRMKVLNIRMICLNQLPGKRPYFSAQMKLFCMIFKMISSEKSFSVGHNR